MYRPSLKSGRSLIALFVLSVILFVVAQSSYKQIKADYYDEKLQAAKLMNTGIEAIRQELTATGYKFDTLDDPFSTGMIGLKLSSVTTSPGLLSEKQTALNPNLAAAFIQELKEAKVKPGDYIAVGITGSNPGANLALYSAMQVLQLKPIIITALSSSMYGANREDFTWLDMEAILKKKNVIPYATTYASFGGKDDLATGISDNGILLLREAMTRTKTPLLSGSSLQENIDLRMKAYQEMLPQGKKYKLFVNIGAALANAGSNVNAGLVSEGLNRKLAEKDFDQPGVMMYFAKKNVPVLHIRRILRLADDYNLPVTPETMPLPGEGKVFSSRIHNIWITVACLILLLAAIIAVIIFDRYDRHFMANLVDPDEEL